MAESMMKKPSVPQTWLANLWNMIHYIQKDLNVMPSYLSQLNYGSYETK